MSSVSRFGMSDLDWFSTLLGIFGILKCSMREHMGHKSVYKNSKKQHGRKVIGRNTQCNNDSGRLGDGNPISCLFRGRILYQLHLLSHTQ